MAIEVRKTNREGYFVGTKIKISLKKNINFPISRGEGDGGANVPSAPLDPPLGTQ